MAGKAKSKYARLGEELKALLKDDSLDGLIDELVALGDAPALERGSAEFQKKEQRISDVAIEMSAAINQDHAQQAAIAFFDAVRGSLAAA